MTEFLSDILTDRTNILTDPNTSVHHQSQSIQDMKLNLDAIRNTPLEELENTDKKQLVLLLLKQLQPYLSASNLSTTNKLKGPQQSSQAQDNGGAVGRSNMMSLQENQYEQHHQNQQVMRQSDEQLQLGQILNNINVQNNSKQRETNIVAM